MQRLYAPTDFDVHLTWGMKDSFIPPAQGHALARAIGAASFTEIAQAAHIVHEDAPADLLGALMQNI